MLSATAERVETEAARELTDTGRGIIRVPDCDAEVDTVTEIATDGEGGAALLAGRTGIT
jgi:hypothetical protein